MFNSREVGYLEGTLIVQLRRKQMTKNLKKTTWYFNGHIQKAMQEVWNPAMSFKAFERLADRWEEQRKPVE